MASDLKTKIVISAEDQASAAVDSVTEGIKQLDTAAEGTAPTLERLGQEVERLGEGQAGGLDRAAQAASELKRASEGAADAASGLGRELNQAGDQGVRGVQSISQQMDSLKKTMLGVFGAIQLMGAAKSAIATADAFGQMAERIEMATSSQEEYEYVQQRLLESANTTYRALAEQQEMYIGSAEALKELGYSTRDVLDITDSYSYLLATNAASQERGAAAVDAYTKALQVGKVEADAWQSILAATPTIVDAIAEASGKTAAEIRALGASGKLSLRDLNEGLLESVEANKAATEGMSATVSDAMTRLNNTWGEFLRVSNESSGATAKLAGLIDMLSDNLERLVGAAVVASETVAAVWGVKALQGLQRYTQALVVAEATTGRLAATQAVAAAAADKLVAAGKLAAAAWVGWEVGSYLREEFLFVEQLGIALAAGLTKSAARAQAAMEMIAAPFTDDTIAAAQERLLTKLQQIDDEYAALFDSAAQARDVSVKASADMADASDEAAAALTRQRNAALELTDALEDISSADLANLPAKLDAALKDGGLTVEEHAEKMRAVLTEAFERAGLDAQGALSGISSASTDALNTLEATAAALDGLGVKGEAAASALEQSFRAALDEIDSAPALEVLEARLQATVEAGKLGAEAAARLGDAMVEARKKIEDLTPGIQSAEEGLRALGVTSEKSLQSLAREATQAWKAVQAGDATLKDKQQAFEQYAQAVADANHGVVSEALKAEARMVGLAVEADKSGKVTVQSFKDIARALTETGGSAQEVVAEVTKVVTAMTEAGVEGKKAAKAIETSFADAFRKAADADAVRALVQQLDALGGAARVGSDGMLRLGEAAQDAYKRIEDMTPGIQSVEEAFRHFGIKTKEEMQTLADDAAAAFEAIKASGEATPAQLQQAFEQYAEAAIAANGGVVSGMVEAEAAALGLSVSVDEVGKVAIKSLKEEAAEAAKALAEATKDAARSTLSLAETWDAAGNLMGKGFVELAREHNDAIEGIQGLWWSAASATSKYAQEASEAVFEVGKGAKVMADEMDAYVRRMEAMDARQQAMTSTAAGGVEALKMRLIELNGTEDEIARARKARDVAEIERTITLMQMDIERARMRGEHSEAARLQQEIALYKEQLVLIDRVFAAEQKQQRARQRESGKSGGSGGSGSGGMTPSGGPTTVNVQLPPAGPMGYNRADLEAFARQLNPVLSDLSRRGAL